MNLQNTLVVLDTCVLLKLRLSDVLMDLRAEKLFSAHWSHHIDEEFLRNMEKIRGITLARAQSRLRAMKARCPEWEVYISSADFLAVPSNVDLKDRHVAAAALALRNAARQDVEEAADYDVILLTDNVKNMATRQMGALGVRVQRPGPFLDEAYRSDPEATSRAVIQAAKELKTPPYTTTQLLEVLQAEGAKTLVSRISKTLGLQLRAPSRHKARSRP